MIKLLLRLLSVVICLGLWAGGIYMSYTETDWNAIKADWGDVSAALPDFSALGGGGSEEEQLPEQNPDDSGTQEPEQNPDDSGTQEPEQNPDDSGTQDPEQNPDDSGTQEPEQDSEA